jgi:hypothetical protein
MILEILKKNTHKSICELKNNPTFATLLEKDPEKSLNFWNNFILPV